MYFWLSGQWCAKNDLVLDVLFPLLGIRLALERLVAVLAAPAGEKADAGRTLVVDDEILDSPLNLRVPSALVKAGNFRRDASSTMHFLPRPHVAVELDQRIADRVGRRIRLGNRAIEQRDGVVALEIGGVRQDQVGEVDHLGMEGVDHHQERNLVLAGSSGVFRAQHVLDIRRVHGRVPRHVGHEQDQRVERIGIVVGRRW